MMISKPRAPGGRAGRGWEQGLPAGVHSYAILPIGYPMGKFGPVGRGPLNEIVYQDRWGEPYRAV